jgi:hypothetical protein
MFSSAVREDLWGIEIDAIYSTVLIWAAVNFAFGPLRSRASASQQALSAMVITSRQAVAKKNVPALID